jgi:hypothetical protein
MKLYHRTDHAKEILDNGFLDGTGSYLTDATFSGVWLSNVPLTVNEGAKGNTLLMVDIPEEVIAADFEWIEEGKPYREFLVPASIVNQYGPPSIVPDEDDF